MNAFSGKLLEGQKSFMLESSRVQEFKSVVGVLCKTAKTITVLFERGEETIFTKSFVMRKIVVRMYDV